ncbi:hypothetical protein JFX59_003295 [Escherichia coli]|nr:hypothetical protein [Escherichia coli]EHX7992991.1 hypothetical protein [Escherichia coli]EJJ5471220.1 hypothetical protein [Escherichia coli]MBJ1941732.1 hypothetical protein [Escherichia coli]MBJ1962249.1 hypothetical protein [Escherichia coli]
MVQLVDLASCVSF